MNAENRGRVFLITPDWPDDDRLTAALSAALSGGDVASVLVAAHGLAEDAYAARLQLLTPLIQQAGAAALADTDTRAMGRTGADGVHLAVAAPALSDAVKRLSPGRIVGAGGAETRHDALELGEANPDYLLFGRIGADKRPAAHPKNLDLAAWWAEFVEIPGVILAGAEIGSVVEAAATGADFVAVGSAVFDHADPAAAVAEINALLDAHAPHFAEAAG
ncbi:MAG TPA: thiamine phosphate synthase [Rhizobiaceae bacterium]|nr:thiamine phosphate synthase [Rhizobiaceae bacterium]